MSSSAVLKAETQRITWEIFKTSEADKANYISIIRVWTANNSSPETVQVTVITHNNSRSSALHYAKSMLMWLEAKDGVLNSASLLKTLPDLLLTGRHPGHKASPPHSSPASGCLSIPSSLPGVGHRCQI